MDVDNEITKIKKLKILMIGPGRKVKGGISTVVDSYYEMGLDRKVELEYIASMEDGNKFKKLFVAITSYIKFCAVLSKFDIVHVHMAAQASFSRKALFIKKAHKEGKKIIIHQHAADFDDYFLRQSNEARREKIKLVFSMAEKVIVLSREWSEFFIKYICEKSKVVVLHNGVIIPKYAKSDYSDQKVLFLGRLGARKGTYDLLESIPKVLLSVPSTVFYLGGDGDIDKFKKITVDGGFETNVKFLGWVKNDEKERYLKACSIFILPSYHEGMPMAVLEAMSYGMATISTNVGGIPQIIENNVNGIRIEAGDINSITENLIELLHDKVKKQRLGLAAAEHIKVFFNVEKTIDEIYKLYLNMWRVTYDSD